MTRDLFSVVFSEMSQFKPADFRRDVVVRLPALLLDVAAESLPALRSVDGASDLEDVLGTDNSPHWRNPELYPHLLALQNSSGSTEYQAHIDALRVHLGLIEPTPYACRSRRFIRLRTPDAVVIENLGGRLCEVPRRVVRSDHGPLVYVPHPGLFDDIAGGLYHGAGSAAMVADLGAGITAAFRDLKTYSQELWSGVSETISVIAFTADDLAETRSFSMRTSYIGGIFSAICQPPALVENIIHEYYHCRLWTWWLVDRPADLPPDDVVIRSPVTGATRPVAVMMQALLIYVGLIDYYRFVEGSGGEGAPIAQARSRLDQLESGSAALAQMLRSELNHYPGCRKFVEILSDLASSRGPAIV